MPTSVLSTNADATYCRFAAAADLAASAVRALFCGLNPGEKRLALYVAFSDEAAAAGSSGEFLVAGYVAREDEWPWFARAWQERVLDGPPKIPYLHLTEIRSRQWRKEHSISFNEAEKRVEEALRVLESSGSLKAFGSVIKRSDLRETIHAKHKNRKRIPRGFDEPDYACFMGFVGLVLDWVHESCPDVKRVNFIVSRKSPTVTKGLNEVIEATKFHLAGAYPGIAELLGELLPASMEQQLPLQAADVLCWHLQRFYSKKVDRTEERRVRLLLAECNVHEWKRAELESIGLAMPRDIQVLPNSNE